MIILALFWALLVVLFLAVAHASSDDDGDFRCS